ncbi:YTH domain-containing protein 1 [Capsella rubella]|uniref:YTH domain-containing protein 1 n=1 Tax=Capsella rubella TaxID=81985 RepID=UPI000CD53B7A|nr:YTH domain-containing protein 1 [Capsella rubella]
MATEKNTLDSEPTCAETIPDPDSTTKKQAESPPTDKANRTATVSSTPSVTVTACANGSDVVSSQPNDNGQAHATDVLKGSHRDKNSSYAYSDPTLRGDRVKRSNCWSQTSFSTPTPPGNFNGVGILPPNTQSQAFRPQFKGKEAAGHFITFSNRKTSSVPYCGYTNGNSNNGFWDQRDHYRKPERKEESDYLVELKCGPRANAKTRPPSESSSLKQKDSFSLTIRRDMYNLPDFQTDYEDAKFFVIKSYSEDDVHKSIKYSVWSSTINGNKKLDAAFRDAETKTREDGKKRPIFLFFSVNASRQFVGLAEMAGYVDFKKDLNFWQVDKWSGFFPVEWHVVKDIPNWELRHIILANNEDKPVTHTRDTHEVKLKEGLQMLSIFKNYSAVTFLLDDMDFYEEREKSLRVNKEHKPATLRMDLFKEKDYDYEMEGNRRMNHQGRGYNWNRSSSSITQASLVNLTKNLSIGGYPSSKKNTGSYST